MTKKVNLPLRDGSIIKQMYNELKDGKVHDMKAFRAKYKKAGVSKPRYMLYRLCRILRQNQTGLQINSSDRTNTVQMVKRDNAEAAREAVRRMVAAKGTPKAAVKKTAKKVAKKKVVKPVAAKSKKAAVKSKPVTKPVVVPAGVDDDDVIEE